ncbi:MAG TPA: hypothetical protein VL625_08840 [Patescibacteria group bacterium]|nr:hypothetical protein [Patescibacteria group bacterium]
MEFQLAINPEHHIKFGPCPCCGNMTERIWGYAERDGIAVAAYFVEWTPGHDEQEANFDLVLGKWGENTSASDRQAVAIAFRHLKSGPSFMVINAKERQISTNALVGEALSREQVINNPISEIVFAVCDSIFLQDQRIAHLRSQPQFH